AYELRGKIDSALNALTTRPTALQEVEAVAWQSQDLIESVSYVSRNFGLARYEGVDRYYGQSTHKFSTGRGARYILPEALNDFLSPKPVTSPPAQAVTEARIAEIRSRVEADTEGRWTAQTVL